MFGLIALIATFTVETNKTVQTRGIIPEGASVTYRCTGSKGHVTAGESATLTLRGCRNIEIESIRLSMKSNKSSGAGSLEVTAEGRTIWGIADSGFDQWYGTYSTDYVDVVRHFSPVEAVGEGDLSIVIRASANSLYIAEYELVYAKAAERAYTVALETETGVAARLTEEAVGSGVVLPELPDENGWGFVGWAEEAVERSTMRPRLYAAGEIFHPRYDMSLWAIYSDDVREETSRQQRVDCRTGFYAIAFPHYNAAYAGAVDAASGTIPMEEVGLRKVDSVWYERDFSIADEMIYYIDFARDSTATITHWASSKPVGYRGDELADQAARWQYRVLQDATVAFYREEADGRISVLWATAPTIGEMWEGVLWTNLTAPLEQQRNMALLFEADVTERLVYYTSYPRRADLPTVLPDAEEGITVPFGIYEIHIRDGKKTIYLRN